jgi:uncharacterized membrane protein YhiD involved in acid resistance
MALVTRRAYAGLGVVGMALSLAAAVVAAPPPFDGEVNGVNPFDLWGQLPSLWHAMASLPLACALGALLAFRPRQRGTPPRTASVIQTQVILAIVGAVVMLIVGSSLARAFGIVGVASLIRYRAKIKDPKDAGVMLAALGVGLASGVGLYLLAVFGTLFILTVLWVIESFEPERRRRFTVTITCNGATAPRQRIEQLFRRMRVPFELRTSSDEKLCYEVQLPLTAQTDPLSNALLNQAKAAAVEWDQKKPNNEEPLPAATSPAT